MQTIGPNTEVTNLRSALRDLIAVSMLPAAWRDAAPQDVAQGLAQVLLRTLGLEIVYIQLRRPGPGDPAEAVAAAGPPGGPIPAQEIARMLAPWLESGASDTAPSVPNPLGSGTLRLAMIPIGYDARSGHVVAASPRPDFPTEWEQTLLSVTTNQAFILLQSKWATEDREQLLAREQAARAEAETAQARYRELVNSLDAILWEAEAKTLRFTFVSRRAEDVLGYPVERWLTEPHFWAEHIHPDDRAWAVDYRVRCTAAKKDHQFEYRILAADGRVVWLRGLVNVVLDEAGEPRLLRGVMFDITAQRQADEARTRLAAIVESSEDAIISKDLNGIITSWNRGAERLFGYTACDAIGQPITMLFPEERFNEEPMILARIRRGERIEHYETVRRRKDGTLLDISLTVSPIADSQDRIVGASKIARDITQRKRAAEKLAAATAKFESVFNQSGIFAGIMDLEGNLREVNDLAVHGCGYTREQVLDRPFWATPWWRGSPEMQARLRAATEQVAAGRVFREELRYWVADGTERRVDFAMHPIRDQSGVVRFLHPTGIDITERKQLETDRLALERAREEFLAAAAHDLKTPLTAIKGTAQLAERRARGLTTPEGERLVAALHQIDGLVNSAVAQINALLDVARLQSGEPLQLQQSPVDLVQVVKEQVERHQAMGTEHTIRLRTGGPPLIGTWDGPRLERVVGNLLSNAIKYSPQGGTIVVTVYQEETLTGPWAVVTVRDRGMGIPPGEVARVFERHFRGSNVRGRIDGTGIGLAGAKQIVEQHEGTLSVTSRLGWGSTFTVRLPLGNEAGDLDAHA